MSRHPFGVLLFAAAQTAIAAAAESALPNETGGVLLGYRQGDQLIVTDAAAISSASGTPASYVRDDVEANDWLAAYRARREPTDPVGYIGEWHSHPFPGGPSGVDLRSIRSTAKTAAGPITLLIYSPSDEKLVATTATRGRFGRVITRTAIVRYPPVNAPVLTSLPDDAVDGDGDGDRARS